MAEKRKVRVKDILLLQLIIGVYTLSGVMAKFAAKADFLSLQFFMFYGMEIFILGVYAILWQQIIKKFELMVAYANKSIAILWSLIWASAIFSEHITLGNIVGILVVLTGTMVVNSEEA